MSAKGDTGLAEGRLGGLAGAASFLTPLGGPRRLGPEALGWLGPVGAGIGAVVGASWGAATRRGGPLAGAAVALAADLVLTGGLHMDGLADAADGLIAPMEAQRRLDAMADPAIGAFGASAVVVVSLVRFAALASARPSVALVASLWAASRSAMAGTCRALPYARSSGGLASALVGERPAGLAGAIAAAGPGAALAVGLGRPWRSRERAAARGVAAAGWVGVVALSKRRIGGFTGDVLGAAGIVAETAGLLAAALARPVPGR